MKIKSKKSIQYTGKVIDLSVENSNTYNVEGLGVHNSAAGCLISYLVGITNIDPIPYNLLFSRFYNASRKGSLPDIDTDVPSEHRDEVIQYIKDKYGIANVSQMATFGRLQGRSAMKEVMSIEDSLSFAEMNAITEFIPDEAEISDELEEMDDKSIIRWALLNRPEKFEKWVKLVDNKLVGDLADTFEKGIKLEGTYKSQGKHAAGIIIAASPLADICPMVRDKEGNPLAGLEMGDLEAIGQVKFDILGVDILSKIQKIAEHGNIDLSDMNCEEAWNLLSGGDTIGVFQLESNLGRTWAKRVKPRNLEELSALVSLIRPGTLNAYLDGKSMTQHYVDRKHGLEDVVYLHPSLENTLKDTYGIIAYQEQSMLISRDIAGFSEQEADNLRKAIGKKLADLMAKVKVMFLEGAEKTNVVDKTTSEKIFEWIEASNRYSFNKCLDPTTTVDTPYGLKMLCELSIGEKVLAPSVNGDEYVEVIDIIQNGEKDLYEIETDSGHTIKCTLDHKFLCKDMVMRPLYEILEGEYDIVVYND